jgi:hypothetical protein
MTEEEKSVEMLDVFGKAVFMELGQAIQREINSIDPIWEAWRQADIRNAKKCRSRVLSYQGVWMWD